MTLLSLDESLVGQTIDDTYLITALLGRGGMGTTYAGLQVALNRRVCIKFLNVEGIGDLESFRRFKREAQVLASLRHKNIVSCFSFGLLNSSWPYLVLELVEGRSLTTLLQDGPLEWTRACALGVQLAKALAFAHSQGFVHRDVKPDNVIIEESQDVQVVKLIDFGLVGIGRGPVNCLNEKTITEAGTLMGTVNYMAPECFSSARPTPAQDIYAFGCLLFELLTGEQPFYSDNPVAVMYKHMNERLPRLSAELIPQPYREQLDFLIARCTEVDSAKRFKTCDQIASLLSDVLTEISENGIAAAEQNLENGNSNTSTKNSYARRLLSVLFLLFLGCAVGLGVLVVAPHKGQTSYPPVNSHAAPADINECIERISALSLSRNRLYTNGSDKLPTEPEELVQLVREFVQKNGSEFPGSKQHLYTAKKLAQSIQSLRLKLPQKSDIRQKWKELESDVLTASGFFGDAISLMLRDGRESYTFKFKLAELVDLHTLLIHRDREIARLRAAGPQYIELNQEYLFNQFVAQYGQKCKDNSVPKDDWKPSLVEIALDLRRRSPRPGTGFGEALLTLAEMESHYGRRAAADKVVDYLKVNYNDLLLTPFDLCRRLNLIGYNNVARNILDKEFGRAIKRKKNDDVCELAGLLIGLDSSREAVKLLNSNVWRIASTNWLSSSNVRPAAILNVFGALNDKASILAHSDPINATIILNECQRLIGIWQKNEALQSETIFAWAIYRTLNGFDEVHRFKETVRLREDFCTLCKKWHGKLGDDFFEFASELELARGLWESGKPNQARTIYSRSVANFPKTNMQTAGWLDWVRSRAKWIKEAGLTAESKTLVHEAESRKQ